MPELPEVETTLLAVKPLLTNKKIKAVKVYNGNLRWPVSKEITKKLPLSVINKCWRRGKYLIFEQEAGGCLLHLGMSGCLSIMPLGSLPKKHDHVVFILAENQIHFNDPRRFGCVLWAAKPILEHRLLARLGPEPLEQSFDAGVLFQATRLSKVVIKQWLMTAKNLVGVGNIYASEALFVAKISPFEIAKDLTLSDCEVLVFNIKKILNKSISLGGTTLKDFYSPDAKAGYFKQELMVYGKAGKPCFICKTLLSLVQINKRSTFYCQQCQKLSAPRVISR